MKKGLMFSVFALFLLFNVKSQHALEIAFGQNDITGFSSYIHAPIELSLPNDEGHYKKEEALKILTSFFEENPSKKFKIKHKSKVNKINGTQFLIGEYATTQHTYRTHFLVKEVKDKVQIIEIRIERQD